jgi:hypothetical protein
VHKDIGWESRVQKEYLENVGLDKMLFDWRRLLEGLDCFDLSQDKEHWWPFVKIKAKFMLNKMWKIVSCSRKILLRLVR